MPYRLPTLKLPRLGLATRLIVTVLLLLFVGISLSGGVTFLSRTGDAAKRFPLADQIAAVHALLERTPAAERPLILRAINSTDLDIRVVDRPPPRASTDIPLRGAEWLISQYLETVGNHEVYATFASSAPSPLGRLVSRLSSNSQDALIIAISLSSREYMLVSLKGSPAARIWGMPVGYWLGAIGVLIAAVVIIAIMREARPIAELAGSVEAFAHDARPRPVTPAGAPEIRTLIESSNEMQARIAGLLKGRTIMLGAISHDLKTFLTRLRLRIETIDDAALRDKAARDIEDMDHMIDNALALANGRAAEGRRESVDLAAFIRAEIEARGASSRAITFAPGPYPAILTGDAVALKRVIANLVDNAVRYGRSKVALALVPQPGAVRLLVDDDGPGIPEAERRAVLEPFYRLEASRNRATGGSGLGLAIARDFVEAHGGTIAIETSPLGGARLVVVLPLSNVHL